MFKKALLAIAVISLFGLAASPTFARDHGRSGPHRGGHGMHPGQMHSPHFGHPARAWHTMPYRPYQPPYTYRRPMYPHPRTMYYYGSPGFGFSYSRPGVSLYFGW